MILNNESVKIVERTLLKFNHHHPTKEELWSKVSSKISRRSFFLALHSLRTLGKIIYEKGRVLYNSTDLKSFHESTVPPMW